MSLFRRKTKTERFFEGIGSIFRRKKSGPQKAVDAITDAANKWLTQDNLEKAKESLQRAKDGNGEHDGIDTMIRIIDIIEPFFKKDKGQEAE